MTGKFSLQAFMWTIHIYINDLNIETWSLKFGEAEFIAFFSVNNGCLHQWFSLTGVHSKNLVAILHLLVALARHFRAPIRLPENVSVNLVVVTVSQALFLVTVSQALFLVESWLYFYQILLFLKYLTALLLFLKFNRC